MMFRTVLLFFLILAVVDSNASKQNLRGLQFEEMRRAVANPKLSEKIKGKSLRQLGIKPGSFIRQGQRREEEYGSLRFFSIYNEFGPSISTLGETAGLSGYIFDMSRYDSDVPLTDEDVVGALRATCSVVGGANGEDHLCTFEILISANGDSGFGTVVASGSLTYANNDGGFLIVEGLGDDFENREQGGVMTLTYRSTGDQNIVEGELYFS